MLGLQVVVSSVIYAFFTQWRKIKSHHLFHKKLDVRWFQKSERLQWWLFWCLHAYVDNKCICLRFALRIRLSVPSAEGLKRLLYSPWSGLQDYIKLQTLQAWMEGGRNTERHYAIPDRFPISQRSLKTPSSVTYISGGKSTVECVNRPSLFFFSGEHETTRLRWAFEQHRWFGFTGVSWDVICIDRESRVCTFRGCLKWEHLLRPHEAGTWDGPLVDDNLRIDL